MHSLPRLARVPREATSIMRRTVMKIGGIVVLTLALMPALPGGTASAAPTQLTVDLSANTGALRYGATGFLVADPV
jgi:hypothetical protein